MNDILPDIRPGEQWHYQFLRRKSEDRVAPAQPLHWPGVHDRDDDVQALQQVYGI